MQGSTRVGSEFSIFLSWIKDCRCRWFCFFPWSEQCIFWNENYIISMIRQNDVGSFYHMLIFCCFLISWHLEVTSPLDHEETILDNINLCPNSLVVPSKNTRCVSLRKLNQGSFYKFLFCPLPIHYGLISPSITDKPCHMFNTIFSIAW